MAPQPAANSWRRNPSYQTGRAALISDSPCHNPKRRYIGGPCFSYVRTVSNCARNTSSRRSASAEGNAMTPGLDCTTGKAATPRAASARRPLIARFPSHDTVTPVSTRRLAAIDAPRNRRRVLCTRTPPLAIECAPVSASTTSRMNRSRKTHSGTFRDVAAGAAAVAMAGCIA